MRLWRVSRHANLSGEGGLLAAGRWHSRGRRVIYTADNPALAVLEVLVHLEIDASDYPTGYLLTEIQTPDAKLLHLTNRRRVPNLPHRDADTQALGDAWLADCQSLLARVPSAVVTGGWNVLINPMHPAMQRVRVIATTADPFDRRLFGGILRAGGKPKRGRRP